MSPDVVNDTKAPHLMAWLRKIYARPATRKALALGRTELVKRYVHLDRNTAA